MRRRELIAGLGGLGVLAGGVGIALAGEEFRDVFREDDRTCVDDPDDPIVLEAIDRYGDPVDQVSVPGDRPTFVKFFATWCTSCARTLPAVTEAHGRLDDEVRFLSVTPQRVGPDGQVTRTDVADWWAENGGGSWSIGIDRTNALQTGCESPLFPSAVLVDTDGVVRWSHEGEASTEEFVDGIESGLER